jgi:hypothetical protein
MARSSADCLEFSGFAAIQARIYVTATLWSRFLDKYTLRVSQLAMLIELRLQRLLIFLAIRAMARTLSTKRNADAEGAASLDRNIDQPLRHTQSRLLHEAAIALADQP